MLAYDYPLVGLFWTMLWFSLLMAWIMLLFRVFADIFRSPDLGGGAKALWSIFVIVAPFLGVFVYLIARPRDGGARCREGAGARRRGRGPMCRRPRRPGTSPTSWRSWRTSSNRVSSRRMSSPSRSPRS